MGSAQSLGRNMGSIYGNFNVVRRTNPNAYGKVTTMVMFFITLFYLQVSITEQVKNDKKLKKKENKIRFLSIFVAMLLAWISGWFAEFNVSARIQESKQNCLSMGYEEDSEGFNKCFEKINFDLQNKRDIIDNIRYTRY
jgi:hypothetical protein